MTSPIFLTLVLIGASCAYLYLIAWSFRASDRRDFSTPWLLLPLSGALLGGLTLIITSPVLPAPPVLFRLLELLAHLCNILLIWVIAGKIAPASRLAGTWLYAWNPLLLVELAVYANTAGVVICLLLLALWFSLNPTYEIATLVLVGLALRINFMALLIAPLWLWFMVRHTRGIRATLMGFTWRALVALGVLIVAFVPGWQGSATFLAITNALHPFDFANSPLSLVVKPVRSLFNFVAQRGHFPPSLMQPATAANMMVLATSFFLFALLYLRQMGRVRARMRLHYEKHMPPTEAQSYEDKHKAPSLPLIHPLSLQDAGGAGDKRDGAVDVLLTGWTVVILGYIILAAAVFMPGYVVWGVWVMALRRFDIVSRCMLLLSCSALLYYPLQGLASASTNIILPLCVFGIPFVYLIVQRYIFTGRIERKNVLT